MIVANWSFWTKDFPNPKPQVFFTFHPKYHLLFYCVFLLPENNDLDLYSLCSFNSAGLWFIFFYCLRTKCFGACSLCSFSMQARGVINGDLSGWKDGSCKANHFYDGEKKITVVKSPLVILIEKRCFRRFNFLVKVKLKSLASNF